MAGAILYLVALAVVSPVLVSAPPARADFREVSIADDEFDPPEIIVQRGDTVVWVHRGVRPHGVRSTDGSFDSNPGCSFQSGDACMRSGERYSRTFDQAGTFAYYCPVHGSANGIGMTGQVTVASGDGGGSPTTQPPPPPSTTTTRDGGTTVRPPTTAASTTQSPGGSTTAPPPGAPTTTVSGIPQDTAPSQGTPLTDNPGVTTTLTLTAPGGVSDDDDVGNLLILVAAVIVLAAAVSATAWYYRPGARPPGGPPPPAMPL